MSSDRELLKFAAKAAEINIIEWPEGFGFVGGIERTEYGTREHFWNPLEDDGDALRLAVNLNLQITPGTYKKDEYSAFYAGRCETYEYVGFQQDASAATRRAIVRAAAEIGRKKSDV